MPLTAAERDVSGTIVAIFGPTASGKTAVAEAVALAARCGGRPDGRQLREALAKVSGESEWRELMARLESSVVAGER